MGRKVKPSTCVYCNTTFPSTNALRAHKAEKFKEENQPGQFMEHFWCEICDRDFHTFRGADEHLRQVREEVIALQQVPVKTILIRCPVSSSQARLDLSRLRHKVCDAFFLHQAYRTWPVLSA